MKILAIDARYTGAVSLSNELLVHLKKKQQHRIALFASVQFVAALPQVQEQLRQHKYTASIISASRTHVAGQLLGCDIYENNLKLKSDPDCFLYIGDGFFHPKALLFAQKEKTKKEFREILCFDPIGGTLTILGYSNKEKVCKKLKANLIKLLRADTIGYIATIKPGQSFLSWGKNLQERFPQKKVYFFLTDAVTESNLESFPFINVWVNSACPRLGFDDAAEMQKSMVNIVDALDAERLIQRL